MTSPLDASYCPSRIVDEPPSPADLYAARRIEAAGRAQPDRIRIARLLIEAERIISEVARRAE